MQSFSESDVQNLLSGLQQLQITIQSAAQNTKRESATKTQQPPSPESTTFDNLLQITTPIKQITDIIKARTPQHHTSGFDYILPNPADKRQHSPGCSPSKKRVREEKLDDDDEMIDTAETLINAISM